MHDIVLARRPCSEQTLVLSSRGTVTGGGVEQPDLARQSPRSQYVVCDKCCVRYSSQMVHTGSTGSGHMKI